MNIFDDNYMWDTVSQFFSEDSYDGFTGTQFEGETIDTFLNEINTATASPWWHSDNRVYLDSAGISTDRYLDIGEWRNEWMKYLPTANEQDYQNIITQGRFDTQKTIDNIFDTADAAKNNLYDRALQGSNTDSSLVYERALATGRLSNFATQTDLETFQNAFETDLFSSIGDMAGLGAFNNLENYEDTGPNPDFSGGGGDDTSGGNGDCYDSTGSIVSCNGCPPGAIVSASGFCSGGDGGGEECDNITIPCGP